MEHHPDENQKLDKAGAAPAVDRPDAGRRRFVIAGVVAAPILVTLAAKPAESQVPGGTLGSYGSRR
jgi:hypothetical protein